MAADRALQALLGDHRSGNYLNDLVTAAKETQRRREQNTMDGGEIIDALREAGIEWREIERLTGIPKATAQRWATPPPKVTP